MSYKQIIQLIQQGCHGMAAEAMYDLSMEQSVDYPNLPNELKVNPSFWSALAELFNKNWNLPIDLGFRLLTIDNYKLYCEKKQERQLVFEKLEELDRDNPNNERITFLIALQSHDLGLYRLSLDALRRLESRFGEDCWYSFSEQALLIKIFDLLSLNRAEELKSLFTDLPEEYQSPFVLCCEAGFWREEGDYDKGVNAARASLNGGGTSSHALFELGANLFFRGSESDIEEAIVECFEPLIKNAKDGDTVAQYFACFVHVYLGQVVKAVEAVKSYIDQQKEGEGYYLAAEIYSLLGRLAEADSYLIKAVENGYIADRHMERDCALQPYRITKIGAKRIAQLTDSLDKEDLAALGRSNNRHVMHGYCLAENKPHRFGYYTTFQIGTVIELHNVYVSTGTNETLIGFLKKYPIDNTNPVSIYNPSLNKPIRCIPHPYFNTCYDIKNPMTMLDYQVNTGCDVLGCNHLSSFKKLIFTNPCRIVSGTKLERRHITFSFQYDLRAIRCGVVGNVTYNSDEVDTRFFIDTSRLSFISRKEFDDMNEDGSYALSTTTVNGKLRDCLIVSLNFGGWTLENVTLIIAEEYVVARLGYDFMTRFSCVEFDNENMECILTL
ncbi:MAG: retropepsin-like domain-containing protein [Bacteroidales bacterium]|nr:retropepsin-like domain-containing protein [Bacteroidales bacterium]